MKKIIEIRTRHSHCLDLHTALTHPSEETEPVTRALPMSHWTEAGLGEALPMSYRTEAGLGEALPMSHWTEAGLGDESLTHVSLD